MTEVWQQHWAGDGGEKGSLGRPQISAKGLRLAPLARKRRGCGWKGKQKRLGFAITTPGLKVERA